MRHADRAKSQSAYAHLHRARYVLLRSREKPKRQICVGPTALTPGYQTYGLREIIGGASTNGDLEVSGLAKPSLNLLFASKRVFPGLKFRNSGSEVMKPPNNL